MPYFTETTGAGGNLPLDAGPREDGTITPEQTARLEGLGTWIAAHADAVYGTVAGLPAGHHCGPSTLSADRRTLHPTCFGAPRETVRPRPAQRRTARVGRRHRGGTRPPRHGGLHDVPGVLWIDAPAAADVDACATVLAVELDGEPELYRGSGRD